ncbi:putative quinol monooxygenase [Vibrio sp. F74]|uniref:putative quinol monooxygenase n=1 Tax=Vibrio sp. F74 TaxID=700020 RepID=UPI0035F5F930
MANLTILAKIEAKPGQSEFVKQEVLKLVEPSRQDEGCIEYRLQADNNNDGLFVMFEMWQSPEMLKKHIETEHFQAFVKNTEGKIEPLVVNEMTELA